MLTYLEQLVLQHRYDALRLEEHALSADAADCPLSAVNYRAWAEAHRCAERLLGAELGRLGAEGT